MTDHQAEQGGPVQGDAASDGSAALARALREMTEQHRRLEMIIDGTAMGTWEWNCQTGQMWVNERWAQIVGYTREELAPITPETFFRLVHPEDLARSNALLREHLEGRSPQYDSLCRMRHKQGHWIWVQDRGRVYEWDAHGQPLRMAGAHADVSDLQNALEDAADMRQRLQAVVDASDEVAVIATDTAGVINLFNTGAEKLLGFRADEVIGRVNPGLFHDVHEVQDFLRPLADADGRLPTVFEALTAHAAHGTWSHQWTFVRKDGEHRQVRLSISPLDSGTGQRMGYVGMAVDITPLLEVREQAFVAAEKFAGAFNSAALGMALVSLEGRWLDVNDALCGILGYTRAELLEIDFQTLTHPDDLNTDLALVGDLLASRRDHYHMDKRYLGKGGNVVWGRLSVSLVRAPHGEPLHFVSQIQDVTAQRLSGQQLRDSEQRTRVTLDAVADMVLTLDLQGQIQYANAAATRALAGEGATPLTGSQVQEVMELTTEYAPRSPLDLAVLMDPDSNAVDLHSDLLLSVGARLLPVDVTRAWLQDSSGQVSGAVWVIRDVTQQRARQREARHLAEVDPLTELSNRRGFEAHLQEAITRVARTGQSASLMFLDLDNFKPINDTHGHLAGDAMLWAVATVLRNGVRDSDVVARLGGDEFAVILAGCSLRRARRIASDLLEAVRNLSVPWSVDRLVVGTSIGIAAISGGMSVDAAVAAADAQCYRAKALGRNNVQVEAPVHGGPDPLDLGDGDLDIESSEGGPG
ncbi:PAS domain S-box protein [Stenotrophomonas aracearum]|jgi:diguanylate cyclase (GGDEF)-like protein/PAS domain S-box-containing protein|uniref:PAS domain S-box protein n=1 Tax=Stenotrophomonas aracearum TaxID=3003272 RepID=A0ABY9YA52_9GAMM|nr:PAS domain S-box protein [Stenotrophomonas sp. A5588]WNH47249.1 PAS domain S-box protein [Stenotrophomonas sp. A5588]